MKTDHITIATTITIRVRNLRIRLLHLTNVIECGL